MTKKSWILGETFFGHFQTLWTYRMRVRACDYIVSDSYLLLQHQKISMEQSF